MKSLIIMMHTHSERDDMPFDGLETSHITYNPIELCKVKNIGITFFTDVDNEDINVENLKCLEINEDEKTIVEKTISTINMLYNKYSTLGYNVFISGYDIKKLQIPNLIKLGAVKYGIHYETLPSIMRQKHIKPWEESSFIDLKEEISFGGYSENFELFKFFNKVKTNNMVDDLKFLVETYKKIK
jgi:hypothetical protein